MRFGALGLLVLLLAQPAVAEELGRLEREALEDALRARGLVEDPAPDGKTIGQIHVVNHEVFSERDWKFQFLNMFHRTTREPLIRREALFAPGQPYRADLIAETQRNLQHPDLSSVVVVVPVVSPVPGKVDVLIVTRDVWSLRLNTDFQFEQGGQQARLLALSSSLSENNLFGWRKQISLYFNMDQGAIALGPTYIDRNIAGTRMTLSVSARALFSREGFRPEGSTSSLVLRYPLWALSRRWGAVASVGHTDGVVRRFKGHDLRRVDFTSTLDEVERYPWIFRTRTFGTGASVTRSFGSQVIQRVTLSHSFSVVRPSFTPDFPLDDLDRAEFARQVFPRSERVSSVGLSYNLFTPRYVTFRNLDTFDLREERLLGPTASAGLSRAAQALGSDRDFYGVSGSGGWAFGWLGGLQGLSAGWSARVERGRLTDQAYSAGGSAVSPVLKRTLRLIATAGAGAVLDETRNNTFYSLGVDNGLRGYAVEDLFGKAWWAGHLEARSMALSVASFRLGGLVFYDVGDAASPDPGTGAGVVRAVRAVSRLRAFHDVGLGLRLLIPQLNAYVIRVDWAVPFQSTTVTTAGLPGRFFVGFGQGI